MPPTLPLARDAFIKAMYRDTIPSERPRLLAVLDAMLAWSAARPDSVRFRADENAKGAVRFEPIGRNVTFWVATPRWQDFPMLELLPDGSGVLSPEDRAAAITRLVPHTREQLDPAGKLHINFGALKNQAARTAVLELMDDLLAVVKRAERAHAPSS